MGKTLVKVNSRIDYIIQSRFVASTIPDKDRHDNTKWHDKAKMLALGVDKVDVIYFYSPVYSDNGEIISHHKAYIDKQELVNIYNQIINIESGEEHPGKVEDDLPF